MTKTMIAICLGFLSFSPIQQFELAFEGKLRCDFIKAIMIIVFILCVSYITLHYLTILTCNFERMLRPDLKAFTD